VDVPAPCYLTSPYEITRGRQKWRFLVTLFVKKFRIMKREVKKHFQKVDPILFRAAEQVGDLEDITPRKLSEYFSSLCGAIIEQQLGGGAALAILGRFKDLFPGKNVQPNHLAAIQGKELRATGMSWRKAGYIKDLAQKVAAKDVPLSRLASLSDEEVIAELTKIKGIGRWTAEMFLISSLGREDVFSFGDLGLKNAYAKLYGKRKMEPVVARWSPFRTWASRVLWRFHDA